VSRPKKMLPVLGQVSRESEVRGPESARGGADSCCSNPEVVERSAASSKTLEWNPKAPEGSATPGVRERTVVHVEGMDCASCAATVEKRVSALPGVARATVNFAAGRLDAEHDPGLSREDLEATVRAAGYGVAKTEEAERTPFWRTPRVLLTATAGCCFSWDSRSPWPADRRSRGLWSTSPPSSWADCRSSERPWRG
jgi:Zn2+/Cd2+-exporting ATPase